MIYQPTQEHRDALWDSYTGYADAIDEIESLTEAMNQLLLTLPDDAIRSVLLTLIDRVWTQIGDARRQSETGHSVAWSIKFDEPFGASDGSIISEARKEGEAAGGQRLELKRAIQAGDARAMLATLYQWVQRLDNDRERLGHALEDVKTAVGG